MEQRRPASGWHLKTVEQQLAGCVGKQKFDRATAGMVARRSNHPGMKAYPCRHCDGWHVGPTPDRMNNVDRKR